MRKLQESTAVPCFAGRNFPALAVIALASLGAGCANASQQAGQAAAQSTKVAAAAPAAPLPPMTNDPVECKDDVRTGTMVHRQICYTARQEAERLAERPHWDAVTQFENNSSR